MPTETVWGEQHTLDAPSYPVDPTIVPKVPVVQVLWNREGGYVQVVSKVQSPDGGRWVGDLESHPETHFTDGMYVDLDRPMLNALIRHLRRARNHAFGVDE